MTSASFGVHGFASHCFDFSPLHPSWAGPIGWESMLIGKDAKIP
jgi:hypothetical protein